jgi:hypothetical protein
MKKENKVVKISDIVQNQIPEFILSDNQNFPEFLKQYYISQEFQSGPIDLAENLIDYKNVETFDTTNLISNTSLTLDVDFFDDQIFVQSTNGWPNKYGLLKIDNEIITYTGITSTSFTGCIRGFSGITTLSQRDNPEFLSFTQSEADEHVSGSKVYNLSNLFIQEFFKKIKYQFTPGFENVEFDPQINPTNFISRAKDFYRTKGTDEAYKILFKVLYDENVQVLKPDDFTFTTSDDKWIICQTFICDLVSGDPTSLVGETLYQDDFNDGRVLSANGSIYSVDYFYFDSKKYFKINLFSGYSNNLNPKGSIFGEFVETPKTYVTEEIVENSTTITVNSTIGFKQSGTIIVNGLEITYTDKTNDQFLNCSGVSTFISPKSEVFGDNFVYSFEDGDLRKKVILRILSGLSGIEETNASYSINGDKIQVDNIGSLDDTPFTKSLIYNLPLTVFCGKLKNELTSSDLEGISLSNGLVRTEYNHKLENGDIVDLYLTDFNQKIKSNVTVNVSGIENQFSINVSGISNYLGKNITARRKIFKSRSPQYLEINDKYISNIQNSYGDDELNYITSNGFPNFTINPYQRKFNFNINQEDYEILTGNHNFYSGELVTVESFSIFGDYDNIVGIDTGVSFFVEKIDERNIKLAYSLDNVGISSCINFSELVNPPADLSISGFVSSFTLADNNLFGNTFGSSKSFKKIPKKLQYSDTLVETTPGSIGILVNGIEIQNYKSHDRLYYGKIESIDILNSGSGYDFSNPPRFSINNGQDTTTILFPKMVGNLEELVVIDPGFDYINTPIVKILGGASEGLIKTEVKMKLSPKVFNFNASSTAGFVSDLDDSFIFSGKHKLSTGDEVIFNSFGNPSIGIGTDTSDGNLIDNSIYYIINVGAGTSFKIAKTKQDSFAGINIPIREYGSGSQRFTTLKKKKIIDRVDIVNKNVEFKYNKIALNVTQVNHYDNIFNFENHGFNNNDEVIYSFAGTLLSGLNTNTNYYIHKLDDNRFKLKAEKTSTNFINFDVPDFLTTHYFEHSPIRVVIDGQLAVNNNDEIIGTPAVIKPIIRGKVTEVKIINSLSTYGSLSILNYKDSPTISEVVGSGCNLQPLIYNGKIEKVVIKSGGSNYFNSIKLEVVGSGYGAKLEPTIVNGEITNITVANPGVGYDSNTSIRVVPTGTGLKVSANIQSWTINEVEKLQRINTNRGVILGKNYSLIGNIFGIFYPTPDLLDQFNIPFIFPENSPENHSPIIGWAYDGCPIYGPDGFVNVDGTGGLKRLRSSYALNKKTFTSLPLVEDYEYIEGLGDLDAHNGRFCVTPEFPNGTYAYFCTVSENRTPIFPYLVGNFYKYNINQDNLNPRINQNVDINSLNLIKHTLPYGVENKKHYYEYIDFNQSFDQGDIIVTNSSTGKVDDVLIVNGGENYKIGDAIQFDNTGTGGFGASAIVSELSGVGISSITSETFSIPNVTFTLDKDRIVGISSTSHSLRDGAFVLIANISDTTYSKLNGIKKISVPITETKLSQNISDESTTGLVTFIRVNSSIFNFEIDSLIEIGNETVKIIGLDYSNNLIKILRQSGSVGHSTTESVYLLQSKFYFDKENIGFLPGKNETYYFNPLESVSVGISTAVGAGNTLTISSSGIGANQSIFLPNGRIFLPNHKFNSGDILSYTPGANSIEVSDIGPLSGISTLYAVKIDSDVIGITTVRNKINSTDNLLLFTSAEDNDLHKLQTNRNILSGNITSNITTINTSESHGLSEDDLISIKVQSGITTSFVVTYDNIESKLKINSTNNPKVEIYENDILVFDLSSATLTDIKFKLYADKNFENEYLGNDTSGLEVRRTSNSLVLNVTENTPKILYYNIESLTNTVYTDETVVDFNTIKILKSFYNKKNLPVVGVTTTSISINYPGTPERSFYSSGISTLSYTVNSSNITGPISKVKLLSKGTEYQKLPKINLISETGKNANIIPLSSTIGKILKSKVINNEFIVSTDKTLLPFSKTYSTIFLYDNYQVDNLEIISRGANYLNPPNVILYSSKNDSIISNFSASVSIKDGSLDEIEVINPSSGLLSTDDKLIFVNNTNGIRILGASYSTSTKKVTLTLETPSSGFTTSNPLPFSVGDKVFIEGVSSIGNGYNSSDYGYETFTLTGITSAFGSEDAAQIEYSLSQNPGLFELDSSVNAYVINYNDLPSVKVNLKENAFYSKENLNNTFVLDNNNNDPITKLVKVKESDQLKIGDIVRGEYSQSKGKIAKIENYSSKIKSDISILQTIGWKKSRGSLSNGVQKLQDNDYYQRFSYSLKSKKSISEWESIVSDVSHVSGYKKFSDLIIESEPSDFISTITTDSSSEINISLDSYVDINTINDFDLVTENVEFYNGQYSDEIQFQSKIISDYIISKENRVLSLDDISTLFNTDSVPVVTIRVDEIPDSKIVSKYLFFIQSSSTFFGNFVYPMLFETFLTRRSQEIILSSYSYYYPNDLGNLSAEVDLNDDTIINVDFKPINPFNSLLIRAIREDVEIDAGITTTSYGHLKSVNITSPYPAEGSPTQKIIYSIPISESVSGTLFVGLSSTYKRIETSYEISYVYNNNILESNLYTENIFSGIGTVGVSTSGSDLIVTYDGISGVGVTVYGIFNFITNTLVSPSTIIDETTRLNSSRVNYTGSSQVAITTVGADYSASKYVIEVKKYDPIGVTTQISLVALNSIHYNLEDYLVNTNYGIIGDKNDLNFEMVFDSGNENYILSYIPSDSAEYTITFFEKNILGINN